MTEAKKTEFRKAQHAFKLIEKCERRIDSVTANRNRIAELTATQDVFNKIPFLEKRILTYKSVQFRLTNYFNNKISQLA